MGGIRRASLLALATAVATPLAIGTSMVMAATPSAPIKVTQTYGENIVDGVACTNGSESHVYRRFDLNGQYGASRGFTVSTVSVGVIHSGAAPLNGQVRVSAIDHTDPFTLANLEPLNAVPVNLKSVPTNSLVTTSITATVPAGKDMVLEAVNPTAAPGEMYLAGTDAADTTEPFITGCGFTEPVTLASVGFPNMNLVVHATGKAVDCTDAEAAVAAAEAKVLAAQAVAADAKKKLKRAKKQLRKAKKAYAAAVDQFGAGSDEAKKAKAKKVKAAKKVRKAKRAYRAAAAAVVTAQAAVPAAQATQNAECAQPTLPAIPKPAPAGQGATVPTSGLISSVR